MAKCALLGARKMVKLDLVPWPRKHQFSPKASNSMTFLTGFKQAHK